jgi:hypothetical protein
MATIDFSNLSPSRTRQEKPKRKQETPKRAGVVDFSNLRELRALALRSAEPDATQATKNLRTAIKRAATTVRNKTRELKQQGVDVPPIVDEDDQQGFLGEAFDVLGVGSFIGGGVGKPLIETAGKLSRGENVDIEETATQAWSNILSGLKRATPGLEDKEAVELADLPDVFGKESGVHPARALTGIMPADDPMWGTTPRQLDLLARYLSGAELSDDPSKPLGPVSGFMTSFGAEMLVPGGFLKRAGEKVSSLISRAWEGIITRDNPAAKKVFEGVRKRFASKGQLRHSERLRKRYATKEEALEKGVGDVAPGATDKYRVALGREEAIANRELENMIDRISEMSANLSADDRVMMTAFLSDPKRFAGLSDDVIERVEDFRILFKEMFEAEEKAGLLSPTQYIDNYVHGTAPLTRAGEKYSEDIINYLGVKKQKVDTGDVDVNPNDQRIKQAFEKEKMFENPVARIEAGLPTEMDISMIAGQRAILHNRALSTKRLMETVVNDKDFGAIKVEGNLVPDIEGFKVFSLDGSKDLRYMMPEDIVDDLNRMQGVFKDAGAAEEVARVIDRAMLPWKGYKLLSPGYHVRNTYSNGFQNYIAGVDPKAYDSANRLLLGSDEALSGTERMVLREAEDFGVFGGGVFAKELFGRLEDEALVGLKKTLKNADEMDMTTMMRGMGNPDPLVASAKHVADTQGKDVDIDQLRQAIDAVSKNTYRSKGKFSEIFGADGSVLRFNRTVGTQIENYFRLAHFVDKRNKGLSPEEAVLSVKKYLFDYGELTNFERKIMKRVLPFYTWSRKNIPLMIESYVKHPDKFNTIGKSLRANEAQFNDDPLTPDYFRDNVTFRLPNGGDSDNPLFAIVDLPVNDLSFDAFDSLPGANPIMQGLGTIGGLDLRKIDKGARGLPDIRKLRDVDRDVTAWANQLGIDPGILASPRVVETLKTFSPTLLNQLAGVVVSGAARDDRLVRLINMAGAPRLTIANQPREARNRLFKQSEFLRKLSGIQPKPQE